MDNADFRQVILDQKNGIDKNLWCGKMLDYLYKVKENPDIAIFAPGRIYNMIMSKGTEKVDESYKIRGYEDLVKYSFFNDRIYGCYNAIHDIMKFLKASSRRTETGKRILILVGPVSSGKSTIATLFKRGLEEYNLQKFAVKGCPLHEEPLHLIPIKDRPYWEEVLGVKIEGHLCPVCLQHMEENNVAWEDMMVTEIKFSEQKRMGVGTFSPSDPKCVKYDTYLLSDKGLMEFSEIYEKIRGNVFSTQDDLLDIDINVDGIDGIEKTSKFYNNGIQKTLDIKTKMQYEISVTETHPLLVFQDGKQKWVKAIDLSIGDYIGLKRGQMMFGNVDKLPMFNYTGPTPKGQNIDMVFPEKLTPPLAKVLGYLVSEGSHDKYSVWFSNNDTHLLNDFKINFESVFGIKPKTYSRDNGKRTSSCNSISSVKLCSFLDQVCGIKHGAENKDIPKIIRTSSKENILAFLEGLFWGDGTISSRREVGSNYFGYSSKSKKMIDQLQIILLNFGIVSSKYTYHHKKGFISHGLSVRSNDVLDLIKFIPSLENKKTDKGSFIEEKDNSNWNVIPGLESVFNEIILKIRDRVGPIYKIPELSQLYRYSLGQRMPRRSSVVQLIENLRKICPGLEETSYLDELVNNNIIWLPIIDIQDGGYQQVYDITVPKTHSFCANGFINHNSQDVSELIGRVNLAKISRYGETDPRAYQFDGELDIANGGMLELIELLKVDTKLLYVFITVAQEQVVKSPGFPQIYIDELLLAHTNLTEFDAFKSDKKNEALHDRIYPIMVPWNTVVNDEIKIYEKMIRESDFRNIHIAPGTLKIAAQFAVLTRLAQSTKIPSLLDKMKLYNGEITEEVRKQDIDIKSLREEGKEKGEGMFGISPRFIINALNVALGMKEDKMCINPIDIIRALRENFDHHMGITNEEKSKYLDLLIGEKDSVRFEFNQFALKEVNMAFLVAYEEQAQSLFDNYVINAQAFCKNERVFDSILQEYSDPDEKLMRSIEELVGVPVNSKKEFRNNLFVYKATLLEQGKPFTFRDYTPLKDAIEKKLVSDLKNIVSLTIADKTITNEKVKKRRKDAIDNMIEKGYCKLCAENLLAFVGESIRKGS